MNKKKVTTNAHARGTYFSPELFSEICGRVAEGQSLNKICAEPDMPSRKSFFQWVSKDPALKSEYEFAIDMRADRYAEEIIEIADDDSDDAIFVSGDDESGESAKRVQNSEFIQRSKLRVDARKWYASKLAPKKYGDKVEQTVVGANGGPLITRIELVALDNGTD